ncbi:PREDICTED: endogenous retrovirus group K member 25 Pol protein-like [Sturnus vulgaris]|uniref:endogenous retrovirus group K member 25 Pol protein-like n=1 Tax=Sturnus vulgaris TaxID=9172 RepID=UPI00071A5E01|nr:PREDICTED: endogenous retrovirus group K member 25 Pol protein-like [Sturnus vulgaris]
MARQYWKSKSSWDSGSYNQAKDIVATCPQCQKLGVPTLSSGVNPRGLESCELWQIDVTHVPQFGRLKYVHVSVDTFSGAVFASAHTGEKAKDVQKRLVQAFSVLGIPKELKSDNGPAYASTAFWEFLQRWGIKHKTGIPYSPAGQGMVECAHQTLKRVLEQQQGDTQFNTPHTKLHKALFTINFLNCSFKMLSPPIVRHFANSSSLRLRKHPPVTVKNPETGKTEGPHELVTWGRGYTCISTPFGLSISPSPQVNHAKGGPIPEWDLEDPPTGEDMEAVEEKEDGLTSGEDFENDTSV